MNEPSTDDSSESLVIAKVNRHTWIAFAACLAVIVIGGAAFDQISEFLGRAIGASPLFLLFFLVGGLVARSSPIAKAKARFWTLVIISIYCATFPLSEYARRAPERVARDRMVAAFDRSVGWSEQETLTSFAAPENPKSEQEVLVAVAEALSARTAQRSRYFAVVSNLDLDGAVGPPRLASAEGRSDALARLTRFDEAIAEFAESQAGDMDWVNRQLAEWDVAPELSSNIVAGIDRGRQQSIPRLMRWLDIQRDRSSVMKDLVAFGEREVVELASDGKTLTFGQPDSAERYSNLRQRLAELTSEEEQIGRDQVQSNERARDRLLGNSGR